MHDYGEFVPAAMKTSQDENIHAIGQKLDMFGGDIYDPGIEMVVTNKTHMLIDSYFYVVGLALQYGVKDSTYVLKEQVSHRNTYSSRI